MYFLCFAFVLFLSVCFVRADCTLDVLKGKRVGAGKIMVKYKHLGAVEDEDGITVYDRFMVTFVSVDDDLYIEMFNNSYIRHPENNKIVDTFTTGTWNLNIYSSECGVPVGKLKLVLPRFNTYSLDPLCEGIDGEDFSLCGKYYNHYVDYEIFKKRVTSYRNSHLIDNNISDNSVESDKLLDFLNNAYHFVLNNLIYFCLFVGLLVSIVIFIVIKKKKNRGVLS